MTNRHGKNRAAKRRIGHKRPAPNDRRPREDEPVTTRPCDSCARWYPIAQLAQTRDTDTWEELWLCPACHEWRTGTPTPRL